MLKKSFYIRRDGNNKPILGSLTSRSKRPAGSGWLKIPAYVLGDCCSFGGDELLVTNSFVATAGGTPTTQIQLDWAAVSKATGYVVERATTANFASPTTVYTGPLLTYLNTGLTTATAYYYRIRATNATSNSNYRFTNKTTA